MSPRSVCNEDAATGVDDPMTTISLAPPGMGGYESPEKRNESLPVGFWDVMRGMIAREVRKYVTSSCGSTRNNLELVEQEHMVKVGIVLSLFGGDDDIIDAISCLSFRNGKQL
ncbi:hypothetical protein L1887_14754 [Cichorium endivia]|nr:hypothetical protein L1887_14754 [Cichorium endivia]